MRETSLLRAGHALQVDAVSVGILAARALQPDVRGVIRAVFERSFYVTMGGAWCCFGPPGLGAGPLNVLCAAELVGAIPALREGAGITVQKDRIRIGDDLTVALSAAQPWTPPPPAAWSRKALVRGLVAFKAVLPAKLPDDGLALLLRQPSDEALPPVARFAQMPAEAVGRIVQAGPTCEASMSEPLVNLLGLGPGLTPSGDDFLGGAMVALARLGMTAERGLIWSTLSPLVATHMNDVSRAHLAAAAEGYGSAALHELLEAVLDGEEDALPPRVAALGAVGHTSGWDAMAGAIAVLRAALRA